MKLLDEVLQHDDPEVLQAGLNQQPRRAPTDKRHHMSLVQGHLLQLGNVPRGSWEAVSGLLNEHYQTHKMLLDPSERTSRKVVWMDDANFPSLDEGWLCYQRDWINTLFLTSQSVDGRQSELMVRGMTADKQWEAKTAAAQVAGSSKTGAPEAKKRPWGT